MAILPISLYFMSLNGRYRQGANSIVATIILDLFSVLFNRRKKGLRGMPTDIVHGMYCRVLDIFCAFLQ